jgi:hypothetical protein
VSGEGPLLAARPANGVRLHVITSSAGAPAPVLYSYNRDDEQLHGAFTVTFFPIPIARIEALTDPQYIEAERYVLRALVALELGIDLEPLPEFLRIEEPKDPPQAAEAWPTAAKVAGEYVPADVAERIAREVKQ